MRSIRLSLVVYFLVLLALALGAVSALVYRTTEQGLRDKQQAMARLLQDRHRDQLDEILRSEASDLANVTLQEERSQRKHLTFGSVGGLLTSRLGADGPFGGITWALQVALADRDRDTPR